MSRLAFQFSETETNLNDHTSARSPLDLEEVPSSSDQLSALHALTDDELAESSARFALEGQGREVENLLQYLALSLLQPRRKLYSASTRRSISAYHGARSDALKVAQRSIRAVEALLLSARQDSDSPSELTLQTHFSDESVSSQDKSSSIASLLSPDGVFRCFVLLIQSHQMRDEADDDTAPGSPNPEQYAFAFLPDQECYRLLNRLVHSNHDQLFPVFTALHDELMQRSNLKYPTPQDTTSIADYCLRDSIWSRGGSEFLESSFDLLLDRPVEAYSIKCASQDTKRWLGTTSAASPGVHPTPSLDKGQAFQLFCRIFLVRTALQAGRLEIAEQHCETLLQTFSHAAVQQDVPLRFALNVFNSMLEHGFGKLRDAQTSAVLATRLLTACLPLLKRSVSPFAFNEYLLEKFCQQNLAARLPTNALATLLHLKRNGLPLKKLVTPATLGKLLESASTKARVHLSEVDLQELVGWENDTVVDPIFLDFPTPLRRSLLASLVALRLNGPVRYLWRRWSDTPNEIDRHALLADTALMKLIVKLFCYEKPKAPREHQHPSWRRKQTPPGPDLLSAITCYESDRAFALHVLAEFERVKPLQACDHHDMNALVSAYFDVGQEQMAFDIYAQLMHRRQIPDETDVLVLLHAAARHNVRHAVRLYSSYRMPTPSPRSRNDETQHGNEPEQKHKPFQGLRPSLAAWTVLLRHCLQRGEWTLARTVVEEATRDKARDPRPKAASLLTFKLMREAFRMGSCSADRPTGRATWTWTKISAVARFNARPETACLADPIALIAMAHAAAHGVSLSDLKEAVEVQRRRGRPAKSNKSGLSDGSSYRFSPSSRDDNLLAAIDLLELAGAQTRNLDVAVVSLLLTKIKYKAQSLSSGGGQKAQRRPTWIAALDRVVALLRQCARIAPAVVSSRAPLLNEGILRQIISAYVELRDWSGAFQARAWMHEALGPGVTLGATLTEQLKNAESRLRKSQAISGSEGARLLAHSGKGGNAASRELSTVSSSSWDDVGLAALQPSERDIVPRDKAWWRPSPVLKGLTLAQPSLGAREGS
ncbi:unnamed protein product [Parajaminaea phylloscopi]